MEKCEKLLAVGDPLQLPPQLVYTKSREGLEEENTLKRTMFVRLNTLGIDTILLKTQYRCHPQFSSLSNSLFYENRLCDGITCDQRNPISTSLPPLVFCDVVSCPRRKRKRKRKKNDCIVSLLTLYLLTENSDRWM